MKWANPATTPETHFSTQAEAIKVNFILLSVFQALWDYGTASLPIGKVMEGNLHPLEIIRDTVLWMACL